MRILSLSLVVLLFVGALHADVRAAATARTGTTAPVAVAKKHVPLRGMRRYRARHAVDRTETRRRTLKEVTKALPRVVSLSPGLPRPSLRGRTPCVKRGWVSTLELINQERAKRQGVKVKRAVKRYPHAPLDLGATSLESALAPYP